MLVAIATDFQSKNILYQSVFDDKCYIKGLKFAISVTMDVSPFAWFIARDVLNILKELRNATNTSSD